MDTVGQPGLTGGAVPSRMSARRLKLTYLQSSVNSRRWLNMEGLSLSGPQEILRIAFAARFQVQHRIVPAQLCSLSSLSL